MNAMIRNLGSGSGEDGRDSEGTTYFRDESTADHATIINEAGGFTRFFDHATAANAKIELEASSTDGYVGSGKCDFNGFSTAADARFTVDNESQVRHYGWLRFNDDSTAANSKLNAFPGLGDFEIHFRDRSTAADAEFQLQDFASVAIFFADNASAGDAQIDVGRESNVAFSSNATAGTADITLHTLATLTVTGGLAKLGDAEIHVLGANAPLAQGGQVTVQNGSSAGNATITVEGGSVANARGGNLTVDNDATAGNATWIANGGVPGAFGGTILLSRRSQASNARIVANSGGSVTISSTNFAPGRSTAVGSIEGAGSFEITALSELITGGRNVDTTVSGRIEGSGRLTKIGSGSLTLGGQNTYNGLTTVDQGALIVNGSLFGGAVVNNGGTLKGTGSIGGTVTVNAGGILSPGTSPGTITLRGLSLNAGSILNFELGDPARDHIMFTNNGNVSLGGTLNISLLGGFTPAIGQSFALFEGAIGSIAGTFQSIIAPTINGLTFNVAQSAGSVLLQVGNAPFLAGDYNGNGAVDAADYVLWRKNLGSGTSLLNDDTPGVGPDDLTRWRAHFGQSTGSGSSTVANTAVPEPSTLVMLVLAAAGVCSRRCRAA